MYDVKIGGLSRNIRIDDLSEEDYEMLCYLLNKHGVKVCFVDENFPAEESFIQIIN